MKHRIKFGLRMSALFLLLGVIGVAPEAPYAEESVLEVPALMVSVEDVRSDFARLYKGLQNAHIDLFAHRSKVEYDALFSAMMASFTHPMSLYHAKVTFQKFVAYGRVAHARIDFPEEEFRRFQREGGKTLPIYPRIVDGRVYVGENYSGLTSVALGDEILSLNDEPVTGWLDRLGKHISADTDYMAHSLLEFQLPKYIWLELGEVAEFRLKLRSSAGVPYDAVVAAASREKQAAVMGNLPKQFSLSFGDRVAEMIKDDIAYFRPGPFYNIENMEDVWNNAGFVAFTDAAFERFIASNAKALIIDLRDNPGGDSSFSDPMLAWIANQPFRFNSAFYVRSSAEAEAANHKRLISSPDNETGPSRMYAEKYAATPYGQTFEVDFPFVSPREGTRFEGEVYVLVNRRSYSNAVTVAAMVQDYGIGKIVGEKTSDLATTFGAMETFELPATGISIGFPKAHIVRPSGKRVPDGISPGWLVETPIGPVYKDVVLESLVSRLGNFRDNKVN